MGLRRNLKISIILGDPVESSLPQQITQSYKNQNMSYLYQSETVPCCREGVGLATGSAPCAVLTSPPWECSGHHHNLQWPVCELEMWRYQVIIIHLSQPGHPPHLLVIDSGTYVYYNFHRYFVLCDETICRQQKVKI